LARGDDLDQAVLRIDERQPNHLGFRSGNDCAKQARLLLGQVPIDFVLQLARFVEHLQATARPGIHARVRNAELSSIFYGSILRYYPEDADGFIKLDYRPPARAPPFPRTGRRKLKTPIGRLSQNWKQSK